MEDFATGHRLTRSASVGSDHNLVGAEAEMKRLARLTLYVQTQRPNYEGGVRYWPIINYIINYIRTSSKKCTRPPA